MHVRFGALGTLLEAVAFRKEALRRNPSSTSVCIPTLMPELIQLQKEQRVVKPGVCREASIMVHGAHAQSRNLLRNNLFQATLRELPQHT